MCIYNLRFIFHSVVGIVIFCVLKSFKSNGNNSDNIGNNKNSSNTPVDNDYVQPGAPATLYGGRAQQAGYDIIDPPNSTQY
jgi:hypothetical protein